MSDSVAEEIEEQARPKQGMMMMVSSSKWSRHACSQVEVREPFLWSEQLWI